jgi:hypothetical protein
VIDKLKILVSLPTGDNDFQVEQVSAAEQAGLKLGIDIEISYAENDSVNQSTQILRALQRPRDTRPEAIVIEPVGGDALPPSGPSGSRRRSRLGGAEPSSELYFRTPQGGDGAHLYDQLQSR